MQEEATQQRIFTISEVNALIPALSSLVGDQLREQSEIEHGLAELMRLTSSPPATIRRSSVASNATCVVASRVMKQAGNVSRNGAESSRTRKPA